MLKYCTCILEHKEDAEDCVQEVFILGRSIVQPDYRRDIITAPRLNIMRKKKDGFFRTAKNFLMKQPIFFFSNFIIQKRYILLFFIGRMRNYKMQRMVNLTFHECLISTIEKIGWSKNYVATTFNINRGTLHKYLSGSLLLPKDLFYRLVEAMPISKAEIIFLSDLYYTEFYGKEKYRRIRELELLLLSLDNACIPDSNLDTSVDLFDSEAFERCGKLYIKTNLELLESVKYLFKISNPGKVYTNYPYSLKDLDDMLFGIHCEKSGFDFTHIIYNGSSLDNSEILQTLFNSVRWFQNRVNPVCCYNHNLSDKIYPFPFFIALNNCVLLFNNDFSSGFLVRDEALFAYMGKTYGNPARIAGAVPLAVFPRDMFELKNTITSNSNALTEASLTRYACCAAIGDEEFIGSVMRKNVPGIERLAQLATDHYAHAFGKEIEQYIIQESGFKSFAENGTIYEIPSLYVTPADKAQRIRYFKKMLELNEQGGLKIIKNTLFEFPKAFGIIVFDRHIELYGYFENIPEEYKSYGNWIVSINDKQLFDDLKSFVEYLNDAKIFYSQKGAEDFLKSMIISLGGTP